MTEVCAIMKQKTLGINQTSDIQSQIFNGFLLFNSGLTRDMIRQKSIKTKSHFGSHFKLVYLFIEYFTRQFSEIIDPQTLKFLKVYCQIL